MRLHSQLVASLRWIALVALTVSCTDSPAGPRVSEASGTLVLSDSVFTRGAVVRAAIQAPAGFRVAPGSVTWTVESGGMTLVNGAVRDTLTPHPAALFALTGTGPAVVRASYTLRAEGLESSLSLAGPTRRPGAEVRMDASQTLTVVAPTLEYTVVPPATVTAGTSLGTLQVAIKDSRGRTISTATDSVVLALDPTSGTPGATLFGTLRVQSSGGVAAFPGLSLQRAGTGYRLIASSPTIATRDTATTAVIAAAPSAAQSTITVADTLRTVGQTTTVTVTVRDQYGNPVLTATPAAFSPAASAGTLGAFTCTNGVCTATYTAPTTPGLPTVGATIGGTQVSGGPKQITVVAGPAAKLVITGDSTQAAGSSQGLTITARDAFGNVALTYTGSKTLTFSGASAALTGTLPTVAGSAVGLSASVAFVNGVATAVPAVLYRVETALLATTDGSISAAGTDRLTVRVFAAAPSAAQSTLAVADSVRQAGQTTTVTVTLKDAYGNPVLSGTAGSFVAGASAGTLAAFTCTNGECTATYTAPAAVATHTITATIGGTAIGGSPKTVRVPDTTAPAISGPSGAAGDAASAKSIPENTTAVHQMTADEPVTWSLGGGADSARFTIDPSTGELTFVAAPDFEAPTDDDGNNTYVVIVRAVDASGNSSTQVVTVTVTNVIEATRFIITGDTTQVAGSTQNITITAADAAGGVDVTYTGTKTLTFSGASTAPAGTVPTIAGSAVGTPVTVNFTNGVATLVATTLYKVETAVLATTDGTLSATGADRLGVRVIVAAASALTSTISVATSAIAQNDSTTVTVTLKDAFGNPVTTATAASFTPTADIGTLRAFTCVNGVCTAQYVGSITGVANIDATIGGTSISGAPQTVNVVGAGLYLSASAQPTVAVNEVTERIIFYVKSGAVRTAVTQLTTFALSSSGTGTFYSDVDGTAVITTASVAATADSFVVYYRQPNAARSGLSDALSATQTAGDAVATGTTSLSITAAAAQSTRFAGTACTATTGNATDNSLTATGGCNVTAGQLLIMVFGHDTDNTSALPVYSAPAGWTLLRETSSGTAASANQLRIRTYYQIAAATGDVTPTFSTPVSTVKTRSTYAILKFDGPNLATPISTDGVASGAAPAGGNITLPSQVAAVDQSSIVAFAVQNIGSNSYVAPAGLTTVAQAGNGGQAITMILFTKDRLFSGSTPGYTVTTAQTARAFVGSQIVLNPQ